MAEQSHKREMNDAVRGDFERLQARRNRARRPEPAPKPERIVLTPAQPARAPIPPEPVASAPREPREPEREETPIERVEPEGGSWLRSKLRRSRS